MMKIKLYNTNEYDIMAYTTLAPWEYNITEKADEVMIMEIESRYVNEDIFIDLDNMDIEYEIISTDKEDDFYSSLEALRESIAKLSEGIAVSSTTYTDALKAFTEGVKRRGE